MKLRKLVVGLGEGAGLWLLGATRVLAYNPMCSTTGGSNFLGIVWSGNVGVQTALGCIPIDIGGFVVWLLPYLFGIAGGIAFLMMVYGFIQMTMSSGDPKAVQGAQETVTSAITGLLVSIFALFLLKLIAVNILHIPGIN